MSERGTIYVNKTKKGGYVARVHLNNGKKIEVPLDYSINTSYNNKACEIEREKGQITKIIINGKDTPIALVLFTPLLINILTLKNIIYREEILLHPTHIKLQHIANKAIVVIGDTIYSTDDKEWIEAESCYVSRIVEKNIYNSRNRL